MSRLDALRALKKAVEDGTATYDHFNVVWPPDDLNHCRLNNYAWRAFNDDLNAARALHDAVRPGWAWCIHGNVAGVAPATASYIMRDAKTAANPARAWLLALIASLIDEEEGK